MIVMVSTLSSQPLDLSSKSIGGGQSSPLLQDYRFYDVFSVVFKISDKCNLNCDYCYRENAPKFNKPQHMSLQVIDRTLASLLQYKQCLYSKYGWDKKPSIYFIWHGGEPLTIGLNQMNSILNIQKKYRDNGLDIGNCIQTNGTLINDRIISIFEREGFQVGISIDGPEDVHNQHRTYRNGNSSFYDTYKGIQLLRERNYPWSAISVITEESLGKEKEIIDFFMKERPSQVDFIPAFFYETDISLRPDSYAEFMINMFDLWASERDPHFDIRFFKDILYILGYRNEEKTSIICELAGSCHRNISIATNGDVYSCECLNSKPSNKIGNILIKTFAEIVCDEPFIHLSQDTNTYCAECLSCDVFFVCKAGCYNRRLPSDDRIPKLDFYCHARKEIIHHVMERAKELAA